MRGAGVGATAVEWPIFESVIEGTVEKEEVGKEKESGEGFLRLNGSDDEGEWE